MRQQKSEIFDASNSQASLRKVLFIAELYPPLQCSVNRVYNIANELSKEFNITVISRGNNRSFIKIYEDKTISTEMVNKIKFYPRKGLIFEIAKGIMYKFGLLNELYNFYKAGIKAIEENREEIKKMDLIIASGPHWDSFRLAKYINDKYGVPYLLDYRDPWAIKTPEEEAKQKGIIRGAKEVIVTTEGVEDDVRKFTGFDGEINIIKNGIDFSLYEKRRGELKRYEYPMDRIRIVYAGTFTRYSGIDFIMNVIGKLDKEKRDKIDLVLCGSSTPFRILRLKKLAKNKNVNVIFKGVLNQNEVIQELISSDLFYLKVDVTNALTGKLFTYLSLNKPFLCFAKKGTDLYNFMKKNKLQYFFDNEEEMVSFLNNLKKEEIIKVNNDSLAKKFDWKILGNQYKEIVEFVIK